MKCQIIKIKYKLKNIKTFTKKNIDDEKSKLFMKKQHNIFLKKNIEF